MSNKSRKVKQPKSFLDVTIGVMSLAGGASRVPAMKKTMKRKQQPMQPPLWFFQTWSLFSYGHQDDADFISVTLLQKRSEILGRE